MCVCFCKPKFANKRVCVCSAESENCYSKKGLENRIKTAAKPAVIVEACKLEVAFSVALKAYARVVWWLLTTVFWCIYAKHANQSAKKSVCKVNIHIN